MTFSDPDEMHILAGEYALGLMEPEDRKSFESELQRNHELTVAVAAWNDRLLALSPRPVPVEPSTALWDRIEDSLQKNSIRPKTGRIWDSLPFWRTSSMAAIVASALLAITLFTRLPDPASPTYVAVLQASNAEATWLVEINNRAVLLRPLTRMVVPQGKAIQFWTKPEGAAGPTSLGLVAPDQRTIVPIDKLPGISPNQLFEVTLEPETGSPTNRPTGAILALGKTVPL